MHAYCRDRELESTVATTVKLGFLQPVKPINVWRVKSRVAADHFHHCEIHANLFVTDRNIIVVSSEFQLVFYCVRRPRPSADERNNTHFLPRCTLSKIQHLDRG